MIAKRRRLAFAAFRLRPLDAFDRVMGDGVRLAQIFEQRGKRREPVPDRAAAKPAPHQVVAPGDDVRARDDPKFLRPHDAGEAHEVLHRVLIGAPRVRIAQIGEPLDLGRHVGQPVELGGGGSRETRAGAISVGSWSSIAHRPPAPDAVEPAARCDAGRWKHPHRCRSGSRHTFRGKSRRGRPSISRIGARLRPVSKADLDPFPGGVRHFSCHIPPPGRRPFYS